MRRSEAPLPWTRALPWALLASTTAVGLQFWLRVVLQVRTLPERMLEWLLLYVPVDVFASGIQALGPEAKVLPLYAAAAVMAGALAGLGALALRHRWTPLAVLGLAAGMYGVAMVVLMPLTGGGLFGLALAQHPVLVNGVYAAIALSFGAVLLVGRAASADPRTAVGRPLAAARPAATPTNSTPLKVSASSTATPYPPRRSAGTADTRSASAAGVPRANW